MPEAVQLVHQWEKSPSALERRCMPLSQISITRQLLLVPRGRGVSLQGHTTCRIVRFIKFLLELSRNAEKLLQAPEFESMPFYELVTSPKHEEIESEVGRNEVMVRRKGKRI
jgi:hypothetical protein